MRLLPFLAAAGIAFASPDASAGTPAPAGAPALAPHAWHDRVLLVFAGGDTPALAEQRRRVEAAGPALAERDLAVIAVVGSDRVERWHGPDRGIRDADAAALRARFRVPAERPFAVFLVGKDGGAKWDSDRPAALEEVFARIDAMPMRRREAARGD